jgi:hypothetical protein
MPRVLARARTGLPLHLQRQNTLMDGDNPSAEAQRQAQPGYIGRKRRAIHPLIPPAAEALGRCDGGRGAG